METRPFQVCLVCSFCSSDRGFAHREFFIPQSGFLQTPPHDGRPCLRLTVPTAKSVVDSHHQVIMRAEHTRKKRCCCNAFFGASNGNRTRIASLGSWSFTIRLYPQGIVFIIPHPARFVNPFSEFFIAGIPTAGKVCTRRLNPGSTGSAGVSGARRGLAFFAACQPCL